MKKLTIPSLLENIFLFAGLALLLASALFYILTNMMFRTRAEALTGQLELIRDSGTVFIFVLGAMFGLVGLVYAAVNAWQKFVSGKPAQEDKP